MNLIGFWNKLFRRYLLNLKQATQIVFTVVLLLSLCYLVSVRIIRKIVSIRMNVVRVKSKLKGFSPVSSSLSKNFAYSYFELLVFFSTI